jgi:hypothetical protein
MEFYAGQAAVTSTNGDANTHMVGALGGSNFQQAKDGNVAKITTKTAGLYAVGARYALRSSAGFRASLALNVPGLGYRRFGPVYTETAEPKGGTAHVELSATDTLYMPAGAILQPKWSTYGTTRLKWWYIWMTRLAD